MELEGPSVDVQKRYSSAIRGRELWEIKYHVLSQCALFQESTLKWLCFALVQRLFNVSFFVEVKLT